MASIRSTTWATLLLLIFSAGCATVPSDVQGGSGTLARPPARLRSGPPRPAEMSKLREGMPLDDALAILTNSASPVIRSAFSDEDVEVWNVAPRDTYSIYYVLLRRGQLDSVILEKDLKGGDTFDRPFDPNPVIPSLPHAGGEAEIARRLHSRATPIASIDFSSVNKDRKLGESQVMGMAIALGFFNPTIWFSDPTKDAWRDYDRAIKSVYVGMTRQQALEALGTPIKSFGDRAAAEYLLFEGRYGWHITVGVRDGVVRGVYGRDLTWAGDAHGWGSPGDGGINRR